MNTPQKSLPETVTTARCCGFTLFELVLVVIVVALAAAILLGRVLGYEEVAEKTAMEQTAAAVRSALGIQLSGLIARGRAEDISKLKSVNPFALLSEVPKNYAGEYYGTPDDIPIGSWYYDLKSHELVYLVQHGAHFQSAQKGRKSVHYRVNLVYNDWLPAAGSNQLRKETGGIALEDVRPYTWAIK